MFNFKKLIEPYDVIFVDVDNTLFNYTYAHSKALQKVLKDFNFTLEDYNKAKINIKKRDLKSNHHKKELYFKNMCENKGKHFSETLKMYKTYEKTFRKNLLVDKTMFNLLTYAKYKHKKVIAVTNYYVIPQIKKLKCSEFLNLIDHLITSEEFEVEKPNTKLLNKALELAGNPSKEKVIMFGDSVLDDLSFYDIKSYPYNCSKLLMSISGKSGAGKSTISALIKDIFKAEIIEGDGYHKYERNHPAWNNVTHYNPEANNLIQLGLDIKNIYQDINKIKVPIYNHDNGKFETPTELDYKDLDVLIIDGLHSLYPEVTSEFVKIKIFIDNMNADEQKIKRDTAHRNKTEDEVKLSIEKREQDYIEYIEKQKQYANFIIEILNNKFIIKISKIFNFNVNYAIIDLKNTQVKENLETFDICSENENLHKTLTYIFNKIKGNRWVN